MPYPSHAALSDIVYGVATAEPALPLQGLTVLAVEDSRYACDALRLICQRSGARLRRAETLEAAGAHLRLYRPDLVLVDLGLPDGRGEGLIRSLALSSGPSPLVLGMSGDPAGRQAALAAGAAGFVEKPIASFAAFLAAIMPFLPDRHALVGTEAGKGGSSVPIRPDPLAMRDDLARAAQMMAADPDAWQRRYLAGFVFGLARSLKDQDLARAATAARDPEGVDALVSMLALRLEETGALGGPVGLELGGVP